MPEAANDEAINGELFIHQPDVDRLMREARRLAKDDPFLAVALLSAGIGMLLHTSPTSGTTAVGAARSSKPAHIFGLWVACFCFNIVWR